MSLPEESRQWDLMGRIEEWMDVYIWEVDEVTIKFANKKSKMILRLVHLLFYGNLKNIENFVSRDHNHITVGDVLKWSENKTSPRKDKSKQQ